MKSTKKKMETTIDDLAVMVKNGFDDLKGEFKNDIEELGVQLSHRMDGVELRISSYASSWEREHSQLHDWVYELDKRVNTLGDKIIK